MKGKALVLFVFVGLALAQWGGVSDYSYKYYDPLELYARVTKDYYLTTPNPVPADYLIDVKPVDKPHGSGVDSKKFHGDVGVVGLPSDVGHEYDESAPRELVISIDSLLDSISLQLAYEGGSSVELSSAHGSIRFYTSSDEILYLDYVDGNVGIGTMSPLYKLDVVGVARFSDSVKVGEYWLPKEIGSMSQVLTVDSTGKLVWMSVRRAYALDTTVVCDACTSQDCVPWLLDRDVVFTANWLSYNSVCTTSYYGIAKGNAGNVLAGVRRTHINLGVKSLTGNDASDSFCTITGGYLNQDSSSYGFIGGGLFNVIKDENDTKFGVICGGDSNIVVGKCSAICGGRKNQAGNGIAGDSCAFIGGGQENFVRTQFSAILGGYADTIIGGACNIGGGWHNVITLGDEAYSLICGGKNNLINGFSNYSGILSGESNRLIGNSDHSVIIGGFGNNINNARYSLAFGQNVTITKNYETAFYSTTAPGVVRITDILILTPRDVFPTPAEEGMIIVHGTPPNRHVYCFINGSWVRLD